MNNQPLAPVSGRVHWIGTGLSTGGEGLATLAQKTEVTLWGRRRDRARKRLETLGIDAPIDIRGLAEDDLDAHLEPGDILVSMLPATEHADLLTRAIAKGTHFACTSYTSPEVAALAATAGAHGLAVLTEAGLDPGIDHLMAHVLVDDMRQELGGNPDRVSLRSFCGGIPEQPGEFRYQFSWAPVGVLTALASPAAYLQDGERIEVAHPWEATETLQVGAETFEVYPNRDSVPFVEQYDLTRVPQVDTFVRGTLRPAGWRAAWTDVFTTVASGDTNRMRSLAHRLAEKYPTTENDRDRVVLVVDIDAERDGTCFTGRKALDVVGDANDTAMARCVSLALVEGIAAILHSQTSAGLHRATANPDQARRWLDQLSKWGLHTTTTYSATSKDVNE
ncbi:saccharopine dehydrogenase C-terminal domain-containing protein [Natronoglycomyces albus]|uniref:Saccharopine dehydrogenase NADP-binding domain-containing protein n=1 Tax=Natronoglycomyces albus TaxID=2811108 RepID=A0A895XUA8_9ACTN|nr:saccharopine dehydrogenase C-terminal domain-containing protein [Natronoglycomyces albus]QSB06879.1 saccharopine dehydrogenase NADP-binding domain-containing protein [Natronoglycomyces albus]